MDKVSGAFVLTPAAGKKLIGMAVAQMPEVVNAYRNGRLAVANGVTAAYVIEALTGKPINRFKYCIGVIANGEFAEVVKEDRDALMLWRHGELVNEPMGDFIKEFERGDVIIKGANAVDPYGFAGGLLGNPTGGTWGAVTGVLMARGVHCIVPVGMEKMIPSVVEASRKAGHLKLKYSLGSPVGLIPIANAQIVTEVQAIELLTGATATPIAAGGIAGNEGSMAYVVEGTDEQVKKVFSYVKQVYKEPAQQLDGRVAPLPHELPEGW